MRIFRKKLFSFFINWRITPHLFSCSLLLFFAIPLFAQQAYDAVPMYHVQSLSVQHPRPLLSQLAKWHRSTQNAENRRKSPKFTINRQNAPQGAKKRCKKQLTPATARAQARQAIDFEKERTGHCEEKNYLCL
jgi:hypothetical protein